MIYILSLVIFLLIEATLFFLVFRVLARLIFSKEHERSQPLNYLDLLKGAVERFVVAFALFHGMEQILTLFGAMKLGTRLKSTDEDKGVNNFYLIGNMVSVLVAISYSLWLAPSSRLLIGLTKWVTCLVR
jgi:hypothetical protein